MYVGFSGGVFGRPLSTVNCQAPSIKQKAKTKKTRTPVVGGWVRVRKRTTSRVIFIFSLFFIVFLNSPHQETPKNVINKIREKVGF
jgi:hypothetical protein